MSLPPAREGIVCVNRQTWFVMTLFYFDSIRYQHSLDKTQVKLYYG